MIAADTADTNRVESDRCEPAGAVWVIDANNVFGSRPDGWWNDRQAAARRFAQRVAEWCRTHDDRVIVVFDPPTDRTIVDLAGGNLTIEVAAGGGRNCADDRIVSVVSSLHEATDDGLTIKVVTSDRQLRERCAGIAGDRLELIGNGRFNELLDTSGGA